MLASSEPVRGKAVRTNIDPDLQDSDGGGARRHSTAASRCSTRRRATVLALAGLAYSAPQPPGSTFKIITATGALEAGIVKPTDTFPVESSNSDIGREIPNAHDELCGGTFADSFADSCNTVFAPLGAELGGEKLVETAELYGFNAPPTALRPGDHGADRPAAEHDPQGPLGERRDGRVGDRPGRGPGDAAGDGDGLADDRQRRRAAAELRSPATPSFSRPTTRSKVTSPETAATMRQLMIGVVNDGTGTSPPQLPGIQVAGKTGTAELGPSALEPGQELGPGEEPPQDIDAWFTAFAPASDPKIVVAAMVVNADGDGGTVAAPIVRQVMASYFGVS